MSALIDTLEETIQVFESGASHNRKLFRTVFAHVQQGRADRLKVVLEAVRRIVEENSDSLNV